MLERTTWIKQLELSGYEKGPDNEYTLNGYTIIPGETDFTLKGRIPVKIAEYFLLESDLLPILRHDDFELLQETTEYNLNSGDRETADAQLEELERKKVEYRTKKNTGLYVAQIKFTWQLFSLVHQLIK